ncbi:MAG: hypothetical protein GXO62_00465 [Epsilonproteobacteria bacterium]|nr:hypothetical protein [Campylobacterota bacterium]
MRYTFLIALVFVGCSVSNTATKVKDFGNCYIKKIPAPFWVCYQSSFSSVGKIHTDKVTRLKQEEAFSLGMSDLINKLQTKTKLFLRRLNVKNDKLTSEILKSVKDFVLLNAIQGDSWYSKTEKMLYVEVKINKKNFKKFLLSYVNDKNAKVVFDEIF